MAHIALYRKYRPNTFESIIAQEHITKILKSQISKNKIGHAYIFSGSRGTGKTTAAKIFSRAVNCLNPVDGNPCNECENCLTILNNSTSDVIEMDAASNNSVDNIREIRQEVVYATTSLKYRVYIIDEAHMLTTSAFNALLKTLEEPPEGVIFILATTEQHKILPTILSRCMKFEFKRIPENKISEGLKNILKEENKTYEEKAIQYIARAADGGLRDAISILERCLDESEEVKYNVVETLIGSIKEDSLKKIINAIAMYKPVELIKQIDITIDEGKEVRQIANDLLNEFMNLLLILATEDTNSFCVFSKEEIQNIKKYLPEERMNEIIQVLNEIDNDIRMSTNPKIIFKAKILTLCMPKIEKQEKSEPLVISSETNTEELENLKEDIDILKEQIEDLQKNKIQYVSDENKVQTVDNSEVIVPKKRRTFKRWNEVKEIIKSKSKPFMYSVLVPTKAYIENNTIYITTENEFSMKAISSEENKELIRDVIEQLTDNEVDIVINFKEDKEDKKLDKVEAILNENNIEYTEIE